MVELAASRSHLSTDRSEVARALDYPKDAKRITEEPLAPPAAVQAATKQEPTPATPQPTATGETAVPETPQEPENAGAAVPPAGGTSSATQEPPPVAGVLAVIEPLLSRGASVEQLRRHVGGTRGRTWTALLNRLVAMVADMRRRRVSTRDQYPQLRNEFGSTCSTLVNAMMVLTVSQDGHLEDGWEKRVLYSNLKVGKQAGTEAGGKDGKTLALGGGAGGSGGSSGGTSYGSLDG